MKYFIKTDKISNLHEISRKVARLDIEADVKQGRFTVDINSILGTYSLNWAVGVTLEFVREGEDNDKLISFISSLPDTICSRLKDELGDEND